MAQKVNVSKRIRAMAKAAKRSALQVIVNVNPPLLPLAALAALTIASLGGYAALNAQDAETGKPQAIATTEERSRFCIRNATDTIIHYEISWGAEPQAEALGPGMHAAHEGPAIVSPYVEFANPGASSGEVHRVKLANAGDCSAGGYSFRYAQSSGSVALARQGGYYLFGAGISPKQYIDEPDPVLASFGAYADLSPAHFLEPYVDAGYMPQYGAEYYEEVASEAEIQEPEPLDLAAPATEDLPATGEGEAVVENELASPATVTVIRGIADGQAATAYPVPQASDQPDPAFDSAFAAESGG